MATTFAAISHSPSDLEADDRGVPLDDQVSTQSLKVQQPFLANLTTLGNLLAPATSALQAGAADDQPGDRGRHQDARPHAGSERQASSR